jgi:hypothetical protein
MGSGSVTSNPARGCQNQGEGQIGCGFGQYSRRVAHRDTEFGTGRHVNIVEAHGVIADHFQRRAGFQKRPVDLDIRCGQQPGAIGKQLQLHIPGHQFALLPDVKVAGFPQLP